MAGEAPATLHFSLAGVNSRDPANIYGSFSVWVRSRPDPGAPIKSINLQGIYVSHDAGDTWTTFAPNLRGSTPIESARLGIDPSDPERIIGHGLAGLVLTTDGGNTWNPVGQQSELESPIDIRGRKEALANRSSSEASLPIHPKFTYLAVRQIEFQPGKSSVIYVVSNKGLFRSTDGARSWCLVFSADHQLFELHSLTFDPARPNRLYVSGRKDVWVSDDGGCNFQKFFDWDEYVALKENP